MEQDTLIQVRASASIQCESCHKKERYMVVPVEKETPIPTVLFMAGSPLTVVVKETKVSVHCYLMYRCQDPMCLLALSRQVINEYWIADRRCEMVAMQQQENRSRRKNDRKRKLRKKK